MFDSDSYFSESQRQLVPVSSMALPYAKNVFNKCLRDHPQEFQGSRLQAALAERLCPQPIELKRLLGQNGEAAYFIGSDPMRVNVGAVRGMFYRIGKKLGVKVSTHREGEFMQAKCEPVEVTLNVSRRSK